MRQFNAGLSGERKRISFLKMLPPTLAAHFPKLPADGAKKTSDATPQYNCIAWSAARDQTRWWQPEIINPWDYWPPGVPNDGSFDCFVALFETLGYSKCGDSNLEAVYEKVALYADGQGFTHVASQLCSGAWTSKLGPCEDIQHNSLDSLEGNVRFEYGAVRQIMKRRCGWKDALTRLVFKVKSFTLP